LVSTGLGALGSSYFLLAPLHSLSIEGEFPLVRCLGLEVSGCLMSVICEGFHREIMKRGKAEEKLRASEDLNPA
jgi:hypothetical protein